MNKKKLKKEILKRAEIYNENGFNKEKVVAELELNQLLKVYNTIYKKPINIAIYEFRKKRFFEKHYLSDILNEEALIAYENIISNNPLKNLINGK